MDLVNVAHSREHCRFNLDEPRETGGNAGSDDPEGECSVAARPNTAHRGPELGGGFTSQFVNSLVQFVTRECKSFKTRNIVAAQIVLWCRWTGQ